MRTVFPAPHTCGYNTHEMVLVLLRHGTDLYNGGYNDIPICNVATYLFVPYTRGQAYGTSLCQRQHECQKALRVTQQRFMGIHLNMMEGVDGNTCSINLVIVVQKHWWIVLVAIPAFHSGITRWMGYSHIVSFRYTVLRTLNI